MLHIVGVRAIPRFFHRFSLQADYIWINFKTLKQSLVKLKFLSMFTSSIYTQMDPMQTDAWKLFFFWLKFRFVKQLIWKKLHSMQIHNWPVEGINNFSSFPIMAFLKQFIPDTLNMTVGQFSVEMSHVTFFEKIHFSNLLTN